MLIQPSTPPNDTFPEDAIALSIKNRHCPTHDAVVADAEIESLVYPGAGTGVDEERMQHRVERDTCIFWPGEGVLIQRLAIFAGHVSFSIPVEELVGKVYALNADVQQTRPVGDLGGTFTR